MGNWKMKPTSGGGDWELPPAGNMQAVCVALIDLGTQQDSYQGQPQENHQLVIVWELIGTVNTKTGKAHVACDKFNASLNKKANLRKVIDAWRGVPLKDDDEFDLFSVVGKPCMLQINHGKSKSGTDIYSIESIASFPAGFPKPVPTYPIIQFGIDDGPEKIPDAEWLPHLYGMKIADKIRACIEFRGLNGQSSAAPPPAASAPIAAPPVANEIPF